MTDETLDALPHPVLRLSRDGTLHHANPTATAMLGEMAVGASVLPHLDTCGFPVDAIARALADGQGSTDVWHVAPDGPAVLLTLLAASPQAERLSRLENLEAVLSGMSEGVMFLDPFARVRLTNRVFDMQMAAQGITVRAGMPYQDLIRHRLDLEGKVPEAARDATADRLVNEVLQRCRDGVTSTMELAGFSMQIEHSMVGDSYLQLYRNVTEETRQKEELRHAAEQFQSVVQDQTELICRYDTDLRITFVNRAYAESFGADGQDLIGRRFLDLIDDADSQKTLEAEVRALTPEGPVVHGVYREPAPDGTDRWMDWSNRALFDTMGKLVEFQAIGRDVTAERLSQQRLDEQNARIAQSEKMAAMGALLASVSHELNNPLSVVLGQSELLEATAPDEATAARATRIRNAADRCARIVRTFLDMARQRDADHRPLDLRAVIDSARAIVSYALSRSDVELVAEIPDTPLPITGNADQLVQVVVNLLLNAGQAMEQAAMPRRVVLQATQDGASVVIRVADSGPGVPDDLAERIFEPFFTTKPEGSGTGIGLALCRSITEAHDGALALLPSDAGAVFELTIPLSGPAAQVADDAEISTHWGHLPTLDILLVDDEPEVADTVRAFLEVDGHAVTDVRDGQAALDALAAADFDIILSDVRMPGLDGPGLWAALEQAGDFPLARVGFLTGDTLSPGVQGFFQQTAALVIEKPFTRADLQSLILRLLAAEV